MLQAIAEVQGFVQEIAFDEFRADARTVKAAAMDFIVIGEAAVQIPADICAAHPKIPWAVMRGMRNRLVHAYFEIDPKVVWDTIHNDLPLLVKPLQNLLVSNEDTESS